MAFHLAALRRGVTLLVVVPSAIFAQASRSAPAPVPSAPSQAPSRAPVKGCKWEIAASREVALSAWVQRCDFGARKIDLYFKGHALLQRYSDGGAPEAVIEVIDLLPGETSRAAITRAYAAHASAADRTRCVIAPYTDGGRGSAGTARFAFVPNASYAKVLARRKSTDIPDPPCGEWGVAPDGIQYFQAFPASAVRSVLFVRVGQDEPLFDEKTLTLVAPAAR
jgi:hypothetical protein